MSRNTSRRKAAFSPVQRRACFVMLGCLLAIVASVVLAWVVLPAQLGGDAGEYDPAQYPVDTSLASVLPQGAESGDYMNGTLFVGGQYAASLQSQGLISLDQYAGTAGLRLSTLLQETCIYFAGDTNSYTIPQALSIIRPRRIVFLMDSADAVDAAGAQEYVADYNQKVTALASAYAYSDIIISSVPPVARNTAGAASAQTRIDQVNQALAQMCASSGYKFLNSAEILKNEGTGYGEDSYFTSSGFTAAGGNALLLYFRQHPLQSPDRRPDTSAAPQRATAPAGSGSNSMPTPTPRQFSARYAVDDVAHGTLTGIVSGLEGEQTGPTLEFKAAERAAITVTAEAADGWTFSRWSDGQSSNPRTDIISQDVNVTAEFVSAKVEITLYQASGIAAEGSDHYVNAGESIDFSASVTLGGEPYDDSAIQWTVNGELQPVTGRSFTYQAGFVDKETVVEVAAGAQINGGVGSVTVKVHILPPEPTPTPTPSPTPPPAALIISADVTEVEVGGNVTLSAERQNLTGDVEWICDELAKTVWNPAGTRDVIFQATQAGTYHITASCDGVTSNQLVITVTEPAPTQAPPDGDAVPAPDGE